MRIAVVGAGPAGLVTLYTLRKRLCQTNSDTIEIICYERKRDVGGEWFFSDIKENDTSTYEQLLLNSPKPFTDLHIDFPWPEEAPTFPSRQQFLQYIQSFAHHFDLCQYIKFEKSVDFVVGNEETGMFSVRVNDANDSSSYSVETFDYVFMCSGQHQMPFVPKEIDLKDFTGEILHYHDLKDARRFYGKKLLVIGSSFAAMDLEIILAKHSEKFYLAWRTFEPFWFSDKSKEGVIVKKRVVSASEKRVEFEDGSICDVDVIIFATGFHQVHPLTGDLDLDFNSYPGLFPIYKHTVHPEKPHLFFVGKAYAHIIPLLRLQAELGCAIINGKVKLPPEREMLEDISKFKAKWIPELGKPHDFTHYCPVLELESEIAQQIAELVGCEPIRPHTLKIFYSTFRIMRENCYEYRSRKLKPDWENVSLEDGIYQ